MTSDCAIMCAGLCLIVNQPSHSWCSPLLLLFAGRATVGNTRALLRVRIVTAILLPVPVLVTLFFADTVLDESRTCRGHRIADGGGLDYFSQSTSKLLGKCLPTNLG